MSLKLNVFFVLSPAHTVSHCSPQPNPTKIISSPRVTKQASGRQRGAERSLHPRTTAHQSSLGLGGRRYGPWHHRPPSRSRVVPSILPPSSLWPALRSADARGLELEEADCRLPAVEDDAPTRSQEAALPLRSSPMSSSSLVYDLC
jgi:hypothetical protein